MIIILNYDLKKPGADRSASQDVFDCTRVRVNIDCQEPFVEVNLLDGSARLFKLDQFDYFTVGDSRSMSTHYLKPIDVKKLFSQQPNGKWLPDHDRGKRIAKFSCPRCGVINTTGERSISAGGGVNGTIVCYGRCLGEYRIVLRGWTA